MMETTYSRQVRWSKYKSDFLRANRCTVDEFEQAYIAFIESNPNEKAYRQFARKYNITIHPDPNIRRDLQVILSVNIAAVKVMASSHIEAEAVIEDMLSGMDRRH